MTPIKHAAIFLNGAAFKPSDWGDVGLPIIRIAQLTGKPFDNYFDGEINRGILIRNGDLLFSWSATIDAFIWDRGNAILNQHIFKVIPKKNADRKYLYYVIKAHAPRWADDDAHGSTMRHIKKESLSNKVWIPDLATQTAIADFLDGETYRIDQLIEAKKRFLTVLDQKWAATVTRAVTNGLNANVKMKDSDLSLVRRVPAHWDEARLGHIGRCANGINIGGEAFGSGTPFVSYSDVYRNPALPADVAGLVEATPEDRTRYSVKAGDVFFTRTSETIEEIGFSSVCSQDMVDAVYAGFLIRFRPFREKLVPEFSRYLFRNEALRAFFAKEMMIVTRASLSQGLLQKLPVLLPPLEEQKEIPTYLQDVERKHQSLSKKTQESIRRLEECRVSLITHAVTGQVDLANWGKLRKPDRLLDDIQEAMGA